MKNKILHESAHVETGVSRCVIQNKYGKFSGYAYFNENDDKDTFSQYAGIRYAEIRATIKFVKLRLKQEKIKLNTIKNLIKDIEYNCPEAKENNKLMRRINLKLRDYSQSVAAWENLHDYLLTSVDRQAEERDKILSRSSKIK